MDAVLDAVDRCLIDRLQRGFPIEPEPYAAVAAELGMDEEALIERLRALLDRKILSRFGPMYHAERLGGGLTLAAMAVAAADVERVAAQINAFPQVAHNYVRDHRLNIWFVLATETPEEIDTTLRAIEAVTGCRVYNMPKQEEFYVGLYFPA